MRDAVQHQLDAATEAQIAEHLQLCDASFVPPLSDRTQIGPYAAKLSTRAVRFEAWCNDELIGLVAAYANVEQREMFISNVSVLTSYRGRGIAAELLRRCVHSAGERDLDRVVLEVAASNSAARRLYYDVGFVDATPRQSDSDAILRMTLAI